MELNDVNFGEAVPIDGYGPHGFRIAGQLQEGAIFHFPGGTKAWAGFEDVDTLLAAASEIDILLVGTGAEITPLPDAFRAGLEAAGIGVEVMGTGPACRTYNVLLAEGRRVGAALMTV